MIFLLEKRRDFPHPNIISPGGVCHHIQHSFPTALRELQEEFGCTLADLREHTDGSLPDSYLRLTPMDTPCLNDTPCTDLGEVSYLPTEDPTNDWWQIHYYGLRIRDILAFASSFRSLETNQNILPVIFTADQVRSLLRHGRILCDSDLLAYRPDSDPPRHAYPHPHFWAARPATEQILESVIPIPASPSASHRIGHEAP